MRICLLSYDTPHLKTGQVMMGLHNRGFSGIDILLTPFTPRPERAVAFAHRPPQFIGAHPRALAAFNGGRVFAYEQWPALLDDYDHFIVCGSNLIEAEFANSGRILNVHAGLIPAVRGLDSFKWAIHDAQPLGNTLHAIDEKADAGRVLAHLPTPIFADDSPSSLAQRHYENEIWMLTHFDQLLSGSSPVLPEARAATMRMPMSVEAEMLARFPAYVERFANG
jgi:phosphoribosylglycinamide formyltransferase-1